MDLANENDSLFDSLILRALSVSVNYTNGDFNWTSSSMSHVYNDTFNVTSSVSKTGSGVLDINSSGLLVANASDTGTTTTTMSSLINAITGSLSTEVTVQQVSHSSDSSILAKITALLVITAVVLVVSYRFVVRLFLGYTDSKDDVFPEGFSDDGDSGIFKRSPDDYDDF